jgi:hypothetical protein
MANYRQMRRRARQVRRAGMQPMMVINADGSQFPEPAAVVLARWAWRCRSELAPVAVMAALLGASWWAHAAFPRWWGLILSASCAGAWLAVTFGARLGLPTLAERIYAASTTFAAGAWLAAAAATGPLTAPLLPVLGIAGPRWVCHHDARLSHDGHVHPRRGGPVLTGGQHQVP